MNESPKLKRTVTVTVEPATPRDPLARSATILTSATRATANEYELRIAEAKEALAPAVAEAAATLAEVERLWTARGESLTKLSNINWPALRLRGVSPDLLNRVTKLVADVLATFSSARYALQGIPSRVANLGRHPGLGGAVADDLELRVFEPLPALGADYQAGGKHQREPTQIRAEVARHTKVADAIREQLATLEYVVSEVEQRLKNAPTADGVTFVKIERPEDRAPMQTRADSDFDPLSYGRS